MNVPVSALVTELRRRRAARPELLAALEGVDQDTWLPAGLADAPTAYLVLAAVSLERRARRAAALRSER